MPWKYRQDGGWILLVLTMIANAIIVIKNGYLEKFKLWIVLMTLVLGIIVTGLIRLYLVSVGETALKHYSLARRYHRKYEKYFKKGDKKMAEYYRKAANKHRERAWYLEEKQGF